jgi:hypothetical protein
MLTVLRLPLDGFSIKLFHALFGKSMLVVFGK